MPTRGSEGEIYTPAEGESSPQHNAFYSASASDFAGASTEAILGELTKHNAFRFRGNEPEQAHAWRSQIPILRSALAELPNPEASGVLLEYSIHRLKRRPDAIVICPGVILVVEFKMGGAEYKSDYSRQAEDYALCLRDFHPAARGIPIVPVVCVEHGASVGTASSLIDGVGTVMLTSGSGLPKTVRAALMLADLNAPAVSWQKFGQGGYSPTPSIVQAACDLYRGHSVAEIGRTDAEGIALQLTANGCDTGLRRLATTSTTSFAS